MAKTWEERPKDDISDLGNHSGFYGAFTRNQADGAYVNGTRIKKVLSEKGDATPNGTLGTVLGSIGVPEDNGVFYFVEWDDKPRFAVGTINVKIGLEKDPIRGFMEEEAHE
jgi:hypothetical protein